MPTETQIDTQEKVRGERRIRTVVAEDTPIMLRVICSFLETQGNLEVVGTAEDGREALTKIEALRPDLVIMDLEMPGMSGLEATMEVRKAYPDTRVIMVSVHEGPEARWACQLSRAHAFVPKIRLRQDLPAEISRLFPNFPNV